MHCLVIAPHRTEYPVPIQLGQGDTFRIGERYEGPEPWAHWYLCTADGQPPGWVPAQVIETLGHGVGRARQDYTARELDVDAGERLLAGPALNGWRWCTHPVTGVAGWVPRMCLQEDEALARDPGHQVG